MTEEVRDQIMEIRESGRTNMFDIRTVQRLAYEWGFYELVNYIEECPSKYASFILTGREE